MANVAEVDIRGYLNFDGWTLDGNEVPCLANLLAQLNLPVFGIRIAYREDHRRVSNQFGGVTIQVGFRVSGSEAVSESWVLWAVGCLREAGEVTSARMRDVDDATGWRTLAPEVAQVVYT
ncbi:MAG TPA: hypothetical protein PKY77_05665 [Phycisphaerae bacterium]|nr:hypothetical protein [Phycisphaerae bacterium]HRY69069.1 hypothetical protein [Phycisphaerae bacterium]HSA25956.1 hypothetical protein [Phycisphaerae bacterium]